SPARASRWTAPRRSPWAVISTSSATGATTTGPRRGIASRRRTRRIGLHGGSPVSPVLSLLADDATLRDTKTRRHGRDMSTTQPLANLADMVRERANRRGNATAYECEGGVTSFAELDVKTNKVANALIALGVRP